jgi:hypothetical protein
MKSRKKDSPIALLCIGLCFFFALHIASVLEVFVEAIKEMLR